MNECYFYVLLNFRVSGGSMLIPLAIIFVFFVAADQISKFIAVDALETVGNTAKFIPHFIRFEYQQNTGMAWGLFPNSRWLFVAVTVIVAAIVVYVIIRYRKTMPRLIAVTLTVVLAGAVGNLIDRLFLGYVRDFIAFDFYDFPVFNIADTCVTIGSILLLISVLFTKEGRKFFGFGEKKKDRAEAAVSGDAREMQKSENVRKMQENASESKPAENISDKPAGVCSAGKTADKAAGKAADKAADKAAGKTAGKAADETADKMNPDD